MRAHITQHWPNAAAFLWSVRDPAAAYAAVLAIPAISERMAAAAHGAIEAQGWFTATLMGPLSSTPYKLYAVLAPHAGAPLEPRVPLSWRERGQGER